MGNSFRLSSNTMFTRVEEENKENPLRIVFLSVEGNKTEQQYFQYVEKYKNSLGINAGVHVHPLRRAKKDNLCAPEDILSLLEEYIELRESDDFPERMRKTIPDIYTDDFIKKYLENDNTLERKQKKEFEIMLQQAGIDLLYAQFLKDYSGEDDIFGLVVDRDYCSHSVTQLQSITNQCSDKGYYCFVTTPCIEFWLLMHLVDIKKEYKENLQAFRDNKTVSDQHTFTSKEVSNIAGHAKSISEKIFKESYLPNIDYAIEQSKSMFTMEVDELIGADTTEDTKKGMLGSNIPKLFELIRDL